MNPILLFALAFNTICTIGMTYYAWRIARLEVTPRFTWSLKAAACMIQLVQIGYGVFFIAEVTTFLEQYPPWAIVLSYSMGALRSGLLFAFVLRVYFTLVAKFPERLHKFS